MRVGEFEKVSFEEYHKNDGFGNTELGIKLAEDEYLNIKLPQRATSGSAGYDFYSPISFGITPGSSIKIPTGIRVKIDDGWWLGILPRSSLGFKYRAQLDNTMGVIDSDYYYSDNEGHIFIKITNDSKDGKNLLIQAGQAFAQAIFLPYGITYSDDAKAVRNGGMGSTDAR